MLLGLGDVLLTMEEHPELSGMALVLNERVCRENRIQALRGSARPVSEGPQILEVPGDVTVMPRDEDRFNVRKVVVESCPSDARFFGDLGHRHGPQPMLCHQRHGGVFDGFAYPVAMRRDGLPPQLWHRPR